MRRYNIDAYRNLEDLKLKTLCQSEYNSLFLSCYDISLLWLCDVYKRGNVGYPEVTEMHLLNVVRALANRQHDLKKQMPGYDRLYFMHELIYRGYKIADKDDVDWAMKTTKAIINWWWQHCPIEHLTELVVFKFPEMREECAKYNTETVDRKYLADLLGISECFDNTCKLFEDGIPA